MVATQIFSVVFVLIAIITVEKLCAGTEQRQNCTLCTARACTTTVTNVAMERVLKIVSDKCDVRKIFRPTEVKIPFQQLNKH